MSRRVGVVLLLACASCQLFLSFGDEASTGAAPSQDASASSDEAGPDGSADSSSSDAGADAVAPVDAAGVADGACILPSGTTGVCPAPGTVTTCQGGVLWNKHCYFTVGSGGELSYPSARQACANADASLATFTCDDEWGHVKSIIPGAGSYSVIDGQSGTKCFWTDDEPWAYAPWSPGNPIAGQDCVKVDPGGWYSFPCGADNAPRALCERQ